MTFNELLVLCCCLELAFLKVVQNCHFELFIYFAERQFVHNNFCKNGNIIIFLPRQFAHNCWFGTRRRERDGRLTAMDGFQLDGDGRLTAMNSWHLAKMRYGIWHFLRATNYTQQAATPRFPNSGNAFQT